ncbi:MAG: endonuclease/exonuclease/phosphatase family protein [Chloroflexota bacterium]
MSDKDNAVSTISLRKIFAHFIRAMIGAYALNTLLHVAGVLLIGERWIVIEFFNTFAHLLWLPALILVPICFIWREWRLTVMLLPALIALLVIWGDMFIPRSAPIEPATDEVALRVATYNILAYERDSVPYVDLIRTIDADIIGIQEVDRFHVEAFEPAFSDAYPYRSFHPIGGTAGAGLMSRYPIVEDEFWLFDVAPNRLGHQRTVIQISETQRIVVYNVHPSHPGMNAPFFNTDARGAEIALLLERIAGETEPVLFLGDFNMPDFASDYDAVRDAGFGDAFRTGGYGFGWTFPNNLASQMPTFLRLDYIFYDDAFRVLHAQVGETPAGSDHLPVFADVVLRGE